MLLTPPKVPPDGLGRTKARGSRANVVIRVLSPRIEPPVTEDDGSIEST